MLHIWEPVPRPESVPSIPGFRERFAYFDPGAHLCFNEREKQHIELYIKKLIIDDIYPLNLPTIFSSSTSSTSINHVQLQTPTLSAPNSSAFDDFMAAYREEDKEDDEEESISCGNGKEESKRISINEELKFFKLALQEFNLSFKPSTSSAIKFWKINKN
ncbi:unnamed protein product [Didymodactylos carnosus]|uniref:Uncharacterized protein n=1 Tax=Didymodactylos carnosus TaxID=1234261 RepID=A0A8S2E1L3_9BILA|nr:unnamed protein product [Didymodactylos carnosus]CAF3801597.1 unnamed protein product [Didymodactylos carnosus]